MAQKGLDTSGTQICSLTTPGCACSALQVAAMEKTREERFKLVGFSHVSPTRRSADDKTVVMKRDAQRVGPFQT